MKPPDFFDVPLQSFQALQGICCLRVYSFNLIHIPVLIIEHNIEFISHVADYLVDVGRNAGNKSGYAGFSWGC